MGIKDTFLSYEDVIFEHEQKRIEESRDSNQDLCKSVLNLSTNLKNRNCIIRGEESKREELSHAICIDLKKDRTNLIYMASVNDNFKSDDAWRSIKKKSEYGKLYFIIEDCHNNVEEVRNLLDEILDQKQNLTNARFLFTLQESEETKGLFPEDWYAVDVQTRDEILEEKTQIEESALTHITTETLRREKKIGQKDLQLLKEYKSRYGIRSKEYLELRSDNAFIGHLPEWRHLYMEEYGAFSRPEKEKQILAKIEKKIQKLDEEGKGLWLHIISGDAGNGKSTLLKLVLQRLVDGQNLEEFPYLSGMHPRIRVFRITERKDWEVLKQTVSREFQQTIPQPKEPLYIIYLEDDLFSPEREDIDNENLLRIFKEASERSKIYFLTTLPSYTFSQSDLYEYGKKFQLGDCFTTKIGNLELEQEDEDRETAVGYYKKMYNKAPPPELLKLIKKEENTTLLMLTLYQDTIYSEYLKSLFYKIKTTYPEYLAALLLSSTLSRFGVHLPITLIQKMNEDLIKQGLSPEDQLPDEVSFYESFSRELGLKLFRIRAGTRSEMNPNGLPDTIAPLHDRLAQVIYETWPKNDDVPLFNCKLWELSNKVYLKLNESSQTRPILANVFRGQLGQPQIFSDGELSNFVSRFGPVQQAGLTLLNEPEAICHWIIYSKYDLKRTKEFRKRWEKVFSRVAREKNLTKAYLILFLLTPYKMYKEDWSWIQGITNLEEKNFNIIIAVLEELLIQTPIRVDLTAEYLCQIGNWLTKHPPTDLSRISYRYSAIMAIARGLHSSDIRTKKSLNNALAQIIKDYLININQEYLKNDIIKEISHLITQINFPLHDSKEISPLLFNYLQKNKTQPVLFDLLSRFQSKIEDIPEEQMIGLYWEVCIKNKGFYGLSHTSRDLSEYLKRIRQRNPPQFRQIIEKMLDSLIEGKLDQFMESFAYPDFLSRFLENVNLLQLKITEERLLSLLRPLLTNFYDHYETKFVFNEVKNLIHRDPYFMFPEVRDSIDRQIRLCLAKEYNLPLELVIKDFTELLEDGQIVIPTYLCNTLLDYFKTKEESEISQTLEDCKKRIFTWLEENKEKKESASVLNLLGTNILFPRDFNGFEEVLERAIQIGRAPFQYIEKWIKEKAMKVPTEQRYDILDLYWGHLLKNSDRKRTYDSFLFLLEWCGTNQDPIWWDRAIPELLRFYDQSVIRGLKPKRIVWRGKKVDEQKILYKQLDCLDKVIDAILLSSSLLEENLRNDFIKMVEKDLEPYKNQFWALQWITRLNPETEIDGTKIFLDYLSSFEELSLEIQSTIILDQTHRWFEWVKNSKREISVELTKIWHWLDHVHPPTPSIFLITALFKVCPKNLHHFKCGNLIRNALKKVVEVGFDSKSITISHYLEWLKTFDIEEEETLLKQEIATLKEIFIWFLQEIDTQVDTAGAVYGLQNILQGALKYKLDFEQVEVENKFFSVLEAHIEDAGGGNVAKLFFAWLFHQNRDVELSKYLQWIKTHYQEAQTPYVLMHLIQSLSENASTIKPTSDEIEQIWSTLKLLIANRLENEGTTLAAQDFMELCHQKALSIDENKLNKIITDSYQLCLQMSNHERVVYLLINFLPFWQHLPDQSLPGNIVYLWRKVSSAGYKKGESFGKLTREVNDYLQKRNEKQSISEFYKDLIGFIEANQGHMLSPKFASVVIQARSHLGELSTLLQKLIRAQQSMEDISYALERYLKCHAEVFGKEELIEFEASIIKALEMSIRKPFAELCVSGVIKGCTPKVHYEQITKLVETYLKEGKESEDFWQILQEYHSYQLKSDIEKTMQNNTLKRFFMLIRFSAEKVQTARYFSAILRTWEADVIPKKSAMATFRTLILHIQPSRCRRVETICKHLINLFGPDTLLSSAISIRTALEYLEKHKEVGLISIKQQLQSELASDKNTKIAS